MAKEGQDNNWNRPKRLNPKPGSLQGGRLDGIAPVGATNRPGFKPVRPLRAPKEPLRLMEDDLETNAADLALTASAAGAPSIFSEEDEEADQTDRLNAEANRQTEIKQQTDQERQLAEVQRAEAAARARQTESDKGQVRESDPLNRQENPQTEANRTPAERTPTEFGKPRTESKPGGTLGQEASAGLDRAGQAAREGAPGAGRVAQTGEKAAQLGTKAVQTGEKVAEAGAKAFKVAAKAAAFVAANWEVILVVLVVVGIGGALFFGISALMNERINSGELGGTPSQAASLNDPAITKAIADLALLAGDPKAVAKNIKQQTELINGYLIEIEKGLTAGNAAQKTVAEAIAQAKTVTEKIMTSGDKDQSANITQLFEALDKVLAAAYGIKVTEPAQIAAKAEEIYNNRASWQGSTNEQPNNTGVPVRDGRPSPTGKQGCDLSGFIVYILRPAVTDCLICATPKVSDLANVYKFLFAVQTVDSASPAKDLQIGDITITGKGNNTGAQVVAGTDSDKKVYYCSAKTGPQSESAASFYGGDRTISQVLRLKHSKGVQQ